MALFVGGALAFAVGLFTTTVGMHRDRALYPAVTFVVASYYVLFAVMGGSTRAVWLESVAGLAFIAGAVAGFRSSLWIVVLALAGHGVFDFVHGGIIDNPGVPAWWPAFCGTYDVMAAAYLAWLLRSGRTQATA